MRQWKKSEIFFLFVQSLEREIHSPVERRGNNEKKTDILYKYTKVSKSCMEKRFSLCGALRGAQRIRFSRFSYIWIRIGIRKKVSWNLQGVDVAPQRIGHFDKLILHVTSTAHLSLSLSRLVPSDFYIDIHVHHSPSLFSRFMPAVHRVVPNAIFPSIKSYSPAFFTCDTCNVTMHEVAPGKIERMKHWQIEFSNASWNRPRSGNFSILSALWKAEALLL